MPLADVAHELLVVLGHVTLDGVVPKAADHALEEVPDLDLEVVRVLVRPVDERGHELRQRRRDELGLERDDGNLDKAEAGLDNLAVGRREEDGDRVDELGEVRVVERGCAAGRDGSAPSARCKGERKRRTVELPHETAEGADGGGDHVRVGRREPSAEHRDKLLLVGVDLVLHRVLHALDQVALDAPAGRHLLAHRDEEVVRRLARDAVRLLGAEDGLGDE